MEEKTVTKAVVSMLLCPSITEPQVETSVSFTLDDNTLLPCNQNNHSCKLNPFLFRQTPRPIIVLSKSSSASCLFSFLMLHKIISLFL